MFNMKLSLIKVLVCGIGLILVSSLSFAEIYKWRDAQGNLHFGDRPPSNVDNQKVKVKINTYDKVEVLDTGTQPGNSKKKGHQRIVMYSTQWCGVCKKAKKYFLNNKIQFVEYDVERSAKGKKDFADLKGTGIPIILIGNKRMNGFNVARFEQLYARK